MIFLGVLTVSLLFSPLSLSLNEYTASFSYTLRLFGYFLFGWVLYSGGLKEIKKDMEYILIYSGAGLSLLGILQLLFFPNLGFLETNGWDPHYFRTVSTFLDPNFAGGYFVLTLALLSKRIIKFEKKLFFLFLIVYLAAVTTFSRSTALTLAVTFFTLSYVQKSIKLFLVTVILLIGFFGAFGFYLKLVAAPRNIDREKSASFRINTWQQGFEIFRNAPVLGVGFNSYRYALRGYGLIPEDLLGQRGVSTNDSSMLFVLATTGVIGFISYLTVLISLLVYSYHNSGRNYLSAVLFSVLLGLLIHSQFANSLFYSSILFWVICLLIISGKNHNV